MPVCASCAPLAHTPPARLSLGDPSLPGPDRGLPARAREGTTMATILIVDDRPANREFLVTLLGYAGHRLLEAANGEGGLAVARAARPDIIITDILMPTMDGYEFVR